MGLGTKHIELQTTYWLAVENLQEAFLDFQVAPSNDIIFPVIYIYNKNKNNQKNKNNNRKKTNHNNKNIDNIYIYISHQDLDWLHMTGNPESWALPSGEQREPRSYRIFRLMYPWNPRSSPWIQNSQNWHSISTDYLLHHHWYHLGYPNSIPDYPPVIKRGTRNGGVNTKITSKSCIFHCHVSLSKGNQE